jgi:hypothetical protein
MTSGRVPPGRRHFYRHPEILALGIADREAAQAGFSQIALELEGRATTPAVPSAADLESLLGVPPTGHRLRLSRTFRVPTCYPVRGIVLVVPGTPTEGEPRTGSVCAENVIEPRKGWGNPVSQMFRQT